MIGALSLFSLLTTSSLTSCYGYGKNSIDPHVAYSMPGWRIQSLPSAFNELSDEELHEEWGREYKIGRALAQQLDFYRAITAFKRAEILAPEDAGARKQELHYFIILSYYLGNRYEDVVDAFSQSNLTQVDHSFPVFDDLMIMLYESYNQIGETVRASQILSLLDHTKADKLKMSSLVASGDITALELANHIPEAQQDNKSLIDYYNANKKSPKTAQALNIIPGAGYWYVGQKQTAITAFLLNSLCIASTAILVKKGNYPAAAIMGSFEAGWFIGGIYGAGQAAKTYNERLYEQGANNVMRKNELFPALTLRYAF